MSNEVKLKTIILLTGNSYITTLGARSIDILYNGTVDAVTFTGGIAGSVPIQIPPGIPYTSEYNDNGYASYTITNGGDADVNIVEKF